MTAGTTRNTKRRRTIPYSPVGHCTVFLYSMCAAVRYTADGQTRIVWCGRTDGELPVLFRGGHVRLLPWGSHTDGLIGSPDAPGYFLRFEQGQWVELETLKSGSWWKYRPQPVKICVEAFAVLVGEFDRWIELKPRQFIQGALATAMGRQRVYVVKVQPPPKYSLASPCWPRIVELP